jgi:phosphoribosylanthranilate isomerase
LSKLWIKICGITRRQDALAAIDCGASAIGVVCFAASPRALGRAGPVLQDLSEQIRVVALFVDPTAEEVRQVCRSGLFNMLQFHGDESAAFCESFDLPYMKAIRVGEVLTGSGAGEALSKTEFLLERVTDYATAEMILLDSFDANLPGGTGKTFDWALAATVRRETQVKLVVAGGLNPGNVAQATTQIQPFGIDVSSGVEAAHGIKDLLKMQLFVEEARSV